MTRILGDVIKFTTQIRSQRMRRLVASGLLPERAGQPVKMSVHISLAELRAMDDASLLEAEWVTEMRIRWAARRAGVADGAACEVHHVQHKAHGGPTSVRQCVLLCTFHHQVVIHRWGWTLVLNPDGTTTAWNPDRTKVLHSHGPPARAG